MQGSRDAGDVAAHPNSRTGSKNRYSPNVAGFLHMFYPDHSRRQAKCGFFNKPEASTGGILVRLLVQPLDSVMPLVRAIDRARKSIELVIFRLDRQEIEHALRNAVNRGIFVHALIARTNRGGEDGLRKLEMRLLDAGITVARTADNLPRYHDKMLIIDRNTLYLLAFNFTILDIERSRSFGIVTKNAKLVQEAVKLFEADTKRQPYTPGLSTFLVSPINARQQLAKFISGAKKELLIYDPRISDRSMIRLLEERARAGIKISIIGHLTRHTKLISRKLTAIRLHTRAIVRDRRNAFIGSQSLRQAELDARREAGVIIREPKIVARLIRIFEEDWLSAKDATSLKEQRPPIEKVMKKAAKAITKEFPPMTPVLEQAVKEVIGNRTDVDLDPIEIEESIKDAVKEALKEIVKDVVEEAADQNGDFGLPS
jgi:cardiolipin synthase A/B